MEIIQKNLQQLHQNRTQTQQNQSRNHNLKISSNTFIPKPQHPKKNTSSNNQQPDTIQNHSHKKPPNQTDREKQSQIQTANTNNPTPQTNKP